MLLHASNLISRNGHGITLTAAGVERARGIVRRHRLAEIMFTQVLEVDAHDAETSACEFEHILAERVVDRVCTFLGHPPNCPHGHPIPQPDGTMPERTGIIPLVAIDAGAGGVISQVRDETPEVLRFLAERGMLVGATIVVREQSPLAGTVTIFVADGDLETTIGRDLAAHIDVEVDA